VRQLFSDFLMSNYLFHQLIL